MGDLSELRQQAHTFGLACLQEPILADPSAVSITLSDTNLSTLRSWTRRLCTAQGMALRTRIVLACAEPGTTNLAVAARLGISNLLTSQ